MWKNYTNVDILIFSDLVQLYNTCTAKKKLSLAQTTGYTPANVFVQTLQNYTLCHNHRATRCFLGGHSFHLTAQ